MLIDTNPPHVLKHKHCFLFLHRVQNFTHPASSVLTPLFYFFICAEHLLVVY